MSKIDHAKRNEVGILQRELRQVNTYSGSGGGGDGEHPGEGAFSIAIGDAAESPASRGVAIGQASYADGTYSTAIGPGAYSDSDGLAAGDGANAGIESVALGKAADALADGSVAIGVGSFALDSLEWVAGGYAHKVIVRGRFNVETPRTPSGSADAQGLVGDIAWDSNFIYVKTSGGWKRSALSTF